MNTPEQDTITQYIREYSSKYGHISADDLAAEVFPPDTPVSHVEAILEDLIQAEQVVVTGTHPKQYTWVTSESEAGPLSIRGATLAAIQHFPHGATVLEIAAVADSKNYGGSDEDWRWTVGRALTSLVREGKITRISRGIYNPEPSRPKNSGRSKPGPKPKRKSTRRNTLDTPPEIGQHDNTSDDHMPSITQFAHFLVEQQIVKISQAQMKIALNYYQTFRMTSDEA
jgi:hypothetical protein